jgi:hypothetical protein
VKAASQPFSISGIIGPVISNTGLDIRFSGYGWRARSGECAIVQRMLAYYG